MCSYDVKPVKVSNIWQINQKSVSTFKPSSRLNQVYANRKPLVSVGLSDETQCDCTRKENM